VTEATDETLDVLQRHAWPGNVRELRNVVERAVIIAGEGQLTPQHLAPNFGAPPGARPASATSEPDTVRLPVGTTVGEGEKALIMLTLKHTKNNKTRAAEILGISLKTLFNKLKEYGSQEPAEA
jgi:DNA-binding NtrC family response regulator